MTLYHYEYFSEGVVCIIKYGFGFGICVFILVFSSSSFFLFSFFSFARFRETKFTVHNCSSTVFALLQHCSRTIHGTHSHFIQKKIKNGSHGTIHTFKNYFATVFSVFSFSKNKLYLNRSLMWLSSLWVEALNDTDLRHICTWYLV